MDNNELRLMRDPQTGNKEYLHLKTGAVYGDAGGLKLLRQLEETEFVLGEKGAPVRDGNGELIHVSVLANMASEYYASKIADMSGRPATFQTRDAMGNTDQCKINPRSHLVTARDATGQLVTMDLAVSDVHTAATLPNYAGGYHISEGVADLASPVILVAKQSDVFYTWNQQNDFNRKLANAGAPGAALPQINPSVTSTSYLANQYTLGGYLPTEVQANADTPLRPFAKLVQMIMDGLRLEREYRVMNLLETSGNWTSSLVNALTTGLQWNGGTYSDPIANLHKAQEQSYMPVTGFVFSELVWHDFIRNPSVQKFLGFKDSAPGIPTPEEFAVQAKGLPPIHVAMMKYVTGGNLTYVWGNSVVALHQPPTLPPVDQMDVATSLTFRWAGGGAPDGSYAGGMLVRTFYDPKEGARGATRVVITHDDIEVVTSSLVGGLITGAHV
jgi:hypothetical protein